MTAQRKRPAGGLSLAVSVTRQCRAGLAGLGDFTVESGQLSAKLGIRRNVLAKDFAADIDMLYS